MQWPRFQLTPDEAKYSGKYEDPRTNKQKVLRRAYTNEVNISSSLRQDAVQFQISRRCRVFGITAAGDIDAILIELIDTTGEQYTAGPVHLVNMLKGWAPDQDDEGGFLRTSLAVDSVPIVTVTDMGPFIQEPNIVLAPNQSLNVNITPANPSDENTSFKVELTLHVYEFPGMPGSPL